MNVVNLFGGPGAGKSTTAAGLFYVLKNRGLRVELVTEYAKALAWAKRGEELTDQVYIYAKQHHRQHVLRDQVDILITDSPLLLPLLYVQKETPPSFSRFVVDNWYTYNNVSYFVNRVKPYVKLGRFQEEEGARDLDMKTLDMISNLRIPFEEVDGDSTSVNAILLSLHRKGIIQ